MLKLLVLTKEPDIPEQKLIERLSEKFETLVVSSKKFAEKLDTLTVNTTSKLDFRPFFSLCNRKFDAAICFDSKTIPTAILLKVAGRLKKIVAYRGTTSRIRVLDPSSWLTFKNPLIDLIVANCDAVRRSMVGDGINPDKISVIFKGHKQDWYEETELLSPDERGDFVTFVNYRKSKGLERICDFVLKHFPTHSLTVFGWVPDHLKAKYKMFTQIKWAGYQPRAFRFLPNFKIFILLSHQEGIPKSAVEASFKKLPVVLNKVGGVEEVWNEQTAVLFPNTETQYADLLERIEKLLRNSELRAKLAKSGLYLVKDKLNFDKTVLEYEKLLMSFVAK